MLQKEVSDSMGDIRKKNPWASLLLALLFIAISMLYWDNRRGGSAATKRCEACEARADRLQYKLDSVINDNNRELRQQILKNQLREASQDSAIKVINKLTTK